MFCTKCGNEINDNAYICVHCGCVVNENNAPEKEDKVVREEKDNMPIIALVLSFFIPLAGLIVGIIAFKKVKKTTDQNGRGYCIAAIVISIVTMVLNFISILFFKRNVFFNDMDKKKTCNNL